jgi:ketosteroid isomerase-like protein
MECDVWDAVIAFADALARGSAADAAALYAEDGKLLTPTVPLIDGRRQIEAYWQAGLAIGLSSIELEAEECEIGQELAVEAGRYALTLAVEGCSPTVDRGTYVVLHRRKADGSWCRAVDVFNPDVPATARP